MSKRPPISIATISDNPDPNWAWLRDVVGPDFTISGRALDWRSFSLADLSGKKNGVTRFQGARKLAAAKESFDLIVSHGPWASAWTAMAGGRRGEKHLAYSFNFTDLPSGARKTLMGAAFRKIDAFAVFTDAEQSLYADYFGLERSKFLRAPWGVAPPISAPVAHPASGDYFAALGGEARDYALLCETAQRCPDIHFVAVARPHNFDGLEPPQNMRVLFDLPFDEAWSVIWHAKAALIPLRSRDTPCGLVTLVGAMHLGKAQIVTDAAGVSEYIRDGETGLLTPAGDADAMAQAVKRLADKPALAASLGDAARAYAGRHCSEAETVRFFKSLMEDWFGEG
ncbi:glycosyltransferase family 4 protein [Hyphococcus sp.]|uniref:glycosyltransferase family 4 protein n=1 Tax=Hyphococcus sp. TaxID=2038636 RepID=UPI003CCBFF2F